MVPDAGAGPAGPAGGREADAAGRAREVLGGLEPLGGEEARAMRWVARDALRELRSERVVARVRRR